MSAFYLASCRQVASLEHAETTCLAVTTPWICTSIFGFQLLEDDVPSTEAWGVPTKESVRRGRKRGVDYTRAIVEIKQHRQMIEGDLSNMACERWIGRFEVHGANDPIGSSACRFESEGFATFGTGMSFELWFETRKGGRSCCGSLGFSVRSECKNTLFSATIPSVGEEQEPFTDSLCKDLSCEFCVPAFV